MLGVGHQLELFRRTCRNSRCLRILLVLLHLQITLNHGIYIKRLIHYILIEICRFLIAHLLDKTHEDTLVNVNLPVSELTLNKFLGIKTGAHLSLAQSLTNLRLSARCLDDIEPFLLRVLLATRQNLHGITT